MAVNYQLRQELKTLIVCLFNPSALDPEKQYTFDSLANYVSDCYWQLEQGERIKRFVYHVAPCRMDAERQQEDFITLIAKARREKSLESARKRNGFILPEWHYKQII